MHVVHLYKDYDPPVVGGIERMIRWTATRTARRPGSRVSVVVARPADEKLSASTPVRETLDGVHVVRVRALGRPGGAPLCPGLRRAVEALKPDVIHLHHPCPNVDLMLWAMRARRRPPFVVTWHSDVVRQRAAYRFYAPLQRWMLDRAAVVMPTSARYLASSAQLAPVRGLDKCRVVPLGIDAAEALRPDEAAESRWRQRVHGAPIVLFVGVLRYYKGLEFLVAARKKMKCDARLVIVGEGPQRADLERQAASLDLRGDAVIFAGRLPEGEVAALRSLAAVAVLPSHLRAEAFGLSQVEAMVAGLPVVACDLDTGVPEVNRHEETGLIVPPADPVALAHAIDQLLADGPLRERLGAAARVRAARLYSASAMETAIFEVYERALSLAQVVG